MYSEFKGEKTRHRVVADEKLREVVADAGMTVEAMTFAEQPHCEILDHARTDEYAAALSALERGEPHALAPMGGL